MFKLNSEKLDNNTVCAAYGLMNAEGRQLCLLQAVLAMLAEDVSIAMTRCEGDRPVDVTEELAAYGWSVHDCPSLEEEPFRYDVFFTLKNTEDSYVLSIVTNDEGVTIEVTGDYEDDFDDPRIQPFLPLVDAVESFAHYLEGYMAGVSSCTDETKLGDREAGSLPGARHLYS